MACMRRLSSLLLLPLLSCQAAPGPSSQGTLTALMAYDGLPKAARMRIIEGWTVWDESRLVAKDGGLANVVALLEVPGSEPWRSANPRMVFGDRCRPRIVFAPPGTDVELQNDTPRDVPFISCPNGRQRNPSRYVDVPAGKSARVAFEFPEAVPLDWL
jgi:hypothetical protein